MNQEFKYEDSLKLFEKIYYDENGNLREGGFEQVRAGSVDIDTYEQLVRNRADNGRSNIVGRSAFSPRILKKVIHSEYNDRPAYKYLLTLDNQGQFDYHFNLFYDANKDNIKEIDITSMSKEQVLTEVRNILEMSNEEIIQKFNIQKTYNSQVRVELALDDVVQDYLLKNGINVTKRAYGPEWGMRTTSDILAVNQNHSYNTSEIEICEKKPEGGDIHCGDIIEYTVSEESGKIHVEVNEGIEGLNTELGKRMLKTLIERFTEREVGLEKQQLVANIKAAITEGQELSEQIGEVKKRPSVPEEI